MKIITIFLISLLLSSNSFSQELSKAFEYFKAGKYELAASEFEKSLPLIEQKYGSLDTSNYTTVLFYTAVSFERNQQYQNAEQYYNKAKSVFENNRIKFDFSYATILNSLGLLYYKMDDYLKALPFFTEASEIIKVVKGESTPTYAISLNNLALLYSNMGNYQAAESLYEEACEIIAKVSGKQSHEYASVLSNLAEIYCDMDNYKAAESLHKEALEIRKRILGENHPDYAISLDNLALLYDKMGNYQVAEPLHKQALEIRKKTFGENSYEYATTLNNLATLYSDIGNYSTAESFYKQSLKIDKEVSGEFSRSYAKTLGNLALLYKSMGDYQAALVLNKQTLEIRKKVLGENHPDYALSLDNMAVLYQIMGNYQAAEPILKQALEIRKKVFGETHSSYATSLNNLASLYKDMGNYPAAELLYKRASLIVKQVLGESNPTYTTSLCNLAAIYQDIGNNLAAETLYIKALEIEKKVLGEDHPGYACSLNDLAELYRNMGNYQAAEPLYKEALEIRKNVLGENHIDFATSLNNLALLYFNIGNYQATEPLLKQAVEIIKNNLGQSHPRYASTLTTLAALYQNMGNSEKSELLYSEANSIQNKNLQNTFSFISEGEKEHYVNEFDFNYELYDSFLFKAPSSSPAVFCNEFNNELLRKGMILASWLALKGSIEASKDTLLVNKYEKLRSLKQQINFWLQKPVSERKIDVSELYENANDIEKDLIKKSSAFAIMNQQFSITWDSVQGKLGPSKAVIEFINFDYYNGKKWPDSTLYCALILRKDFKYPKMIYLFEERQINALLTAASASEEGIIQTYYNNNEESKVKKLFRLIWGPFEPYLTGVNKVYFAVSGQLNRVAFHALTDEGGNLLLNKYDLVQLSSTREIALLKTDRRLESIAIFGGIDYSTDTTDMLAMAREVNSENIPRSVYRSDSTSRNLSLRYLPGTMEEAKEVGKECQEKGIDVNLFSGKQATEEQFKLLGEKKSPTIIHVATHGFYFPEEKQKDREERMRFMQLGQEENRFVYSPDPLIRSGLAMAGANHAWNGEKLPEGVEDGILTARDVSQLNLLNTELVVLSACQTGLGDVKGSEGVYGLQRAFKMAGARYLMMSLWKVPDETTKEFMVAFYGHLSSGMNIRDSYRNTQKEMGAKYPDNPFKWAAFVLLE